jgi:hypothetical protein
MFFQKGFIGYIMADPTLRDQIHVPKAPSGRRGSQARSIFPHGAVNHLDIRELLRNSAVHFGGNDATVGHLLDVNYRNLISGDPRMHSKHGIALYEPLNHFTEHDAPRLAHGLLGARRRASPQTRDLYTAAIHHMGYRFDEHGHIHKVQNADFNAALKNSAFRAHIAVENDRAAYQQDRRHDDIDARGSRFRTSTNMRGLTAGDGSRGLDAFDRSGSGGLDRSRDSRRGLTPGP